MRSADRRLRALESRASSAPRPEIVALMASILMTRPTATDKDSAVVEALHIYEKARRLCETGALEKQDGQ